MSSQATAPAPPGALPALAADRFREAIFVLILLAVWVTTRPYDPPQPGVVGAATSDLVNQLTFSALAVASVIGLALGDLRRIRPLLQLSYAAMLGWLLVSISPALDMGSSFRALAFTLIAMILAAALLALPRDYARFQTLFFGTALLTLAVAWAGVMLLPDIAIHTDVDTFEPEHAGSWRGHFSHKNIAGAMMAVFAIIGVYALRSGRRAVGLALLIGAVTFLYLTRSKTSLGLLPIVLVLAYLAERIPFLVVRAGLLLGPILALNVLTLGSALYPDIAEFNRTLLKDPSFTGRFDIWRFGFEKLAERPWTGFGFESFWLTDHTMRGESKLELAWAVQNIIHGHNGYLDVLLTLGIPGLVLVVYIFLLKPVWDYHHHQPGDANRRFAGACLAIWLFISLGMCLEVFYFRRADPIWFSLLIAVFGLRMAARLKLANRA
jgi:O-antigen ligase